MSSKQFIIFSRIDKIGIVRIFDEGVGVINRAPIRLLFVGIDPFLGPYFGVHPVDHFAIEILIGPEMCDAPQNSPSQSLRQRPFLY